MVVQSFLRQDKDITNLNTVHVEQGEEPQRLYPGQPEPVQRKSPLAGTTETDLDSGSPRALAASREKPGLNTGGWEKAQTLLS